MPINDCDNLNIAKNHKGQPLTDWQGDVASLIGEMKRRAGVGTDQELAHFMGSAQSTVANWRKRKRVPEAALLRYERALADSSDDSSARTVFARCVALRLPELWFQGMRSENRSREVPYLTVSMTINAITNEVSRNMVRLEKERGLSPNEAMKVLLEDEHFLTGLLDWVREASMSEILGREYQARHVQEP